MTDTTDQPIEPGEGKLPADAAGAASNSGVIKKAALVLGLAGAAYMGYIIVQEDKKQEVPKSEAQKALEKLRQNQAKNQDQQVAASQVDQGKVTTEQAQGDPEALKLLAKVRADKEAEARAEMEAQEIAQMNIEELHYRRKVQLLTHDPEQAARWEARMRDAASKGQGIGSRALTEKEEEAVRSKAPAIWANLVKARALNGQRNVAPGRPGQGGGQGGGAVQLVAGGRPPVPGAYSAALAPGALPPSVDPKTGLPTGAAGTGEAPLISGLKPDGTPDIEGGAYPITFTYTPVGEKNAVQATMWVKPGYLTGRVRPYNPSELQDADRQYRSSLKASPEVNEKEAVNVTMGVRVAPSKTRVVSDFTFQQRYVTVQPNPNGQLTPPNPPQPQSQRR